MKICIDARAAYNLTDGIGRYTFELLKAYSELSDSNQYIILKNPHLTASLIFNDKFTEIVVSERRYGLKEQFALPRLLNSLNLDIFHSLHFTLPIAYKGVQVVTVHDIMPLVFPWFFGNEGVKSKILSKYLTILVKLTLKAATLAIVDSDSTGKDLSNFLRVDNKKIVKIYLGAEHLQTIVDEDSKGEIITNLQISKPYLLTITNFRPYKNFPFLLEAFKIVRQYIPELKLVVLGKNPKYLKRIQDKLSNFEDENIQYLGYVPDNLLPTIIKSSQIFVFPSLYEGFGFPIIEAMNCGAPVITSSSASLPEIGGDSVIYINPTNVNELAEAIINTYQDPIIRQTLIQKGYLQSKKFSWKWTAEQTLNTYKRAIEITKDRGVNSL